MPKNIAVFSDGTGQAGGLLPDERRSNVYKLFRACRVGPDSSIDPYDQQAYYDPGLGSNADGGGLKVGWARWIYNIVSQATGFGITRNIIDCYAEIIRLYEPEDRIFLFGFSRGAYTVRCVGGVLKSCGVPTRMKDGSPLKRDPKTCRALANEAVKKVYQHGSGRGQKRFHAQRVVLAQNFREQYASGTKDKANAAPYFVGVWDTVASTGVRWPIAIFLLFLVLAAVAWLSGNLLPLISYFSTPPSFATLYMYSLIFVAVAIALWIFVVRWRSATGTGYPWLKTVHFTGWRMRFYDTSLDPTVKFAKHALSIDENRADFPRVAWSDFGDRSNEDAWFEQIWFAGNHSDIGGSYPENESRLSDISLEWMADKAASVPHALALDQRFLNLFPSSAGMQHNERKSSRLPWKKKIRRIDPNAPLHPKVVERFEHEEVLHFDEMKPYRPENLQAHEKVGHYYQ